MRTEWTAEKLADARHFSTASDPPLTRASGWPPSGAAPVALLDGVEPGDTLEGLLGNERAFGLEDVNELAPDVGQAGGLAEAA